MIRGNLREIDLIDPSPHYCCSLEQETSEREQVAAIVDDRVVRGPRRLLQRRRKCLHLRPHHLARTHLSRYAISVDSAEKAWL